MTKVSILLAMSVLPLSAYAAGLTSPAPSVCVETIAISGQMVSVAGK